MANKIQKFCLAIRRGGEYILYQLSSNFVQMRGGETLQQKADIIDASISELGEETNALATRCSNVESRCTKAESLINTIGTRWTASSTGDGTRLTSGKGKAVQNFTLGPGTFLVCINTNFSINKTGTRLVKLSTESGNVSNGRGTMVMPATSGFATCFTYVRVVAVTKSTKYYINMYQNSGSTIKAYSSYTVVRLK